jgi:hypothetical protein
LSVLAFVSGGNELMWGQHTQAHARAHTYTHRLVPRESGWRGRVSSNGVLYKREMKRDGCI